MATFDPSQPEQWYPVPNFPAYELSSHLRLRSRHTGPRHHKRKRPPTVIKTHRDDRGYSKLLLWKDGRYHNLYLHHVVALLSFGPCPPGQIVRHLDDDKSNNWPHNLSYGTHSDNAEDCKRNGRVVVARGEGKANAVFTDRTVRAIKRLHGYGVAASIIAECFDQPPKQIYSILAGKRWAHVVDEEAE